MDRNASLTQAQQLLLSIGVVELAEFTELKPATIRDRLCRRPETLPKPINSGGKAPPRWLVADVLAWARGEEPQAAAQPFPSEKTRRRGRPRKVARGGAA